MQPTGETVMLGLVPALLMASVVIGCDRARHEGALDQDGGSRHGEKAG